MSYLISVIEVDDITVATIEIERTTFDVIDVDGERFALKVTPRQAALLRGSCGDDEPGNFGHDCALTSQHHGTHRCWCGEEWEQ